MLLVSEGKDASSCVRVRRDARGKKGVQSRHSDPPILLAVGAERAESTMVRVDLKLVPLWAALMKPARVGFRMVPVVGTEGQIDVLS